MEHLVEFIGRHWPLVTLFLILLVLAAVFEGLALRKQAKSLSTDKAIDLINNHQAMIVDIRPLEQFNEGHIIHAIRAVEADFKLPNFQRHKDKPIILVCARGLESSPLASRLQALEFKQIFSLAGGLESWKAAQLPLVKK